MSSLKETRYPNIDELYHSLDEMDELTSDDFIITLLDTTSPDGNDQEATLHHHEGRYINKYKSVEDCVIDMIEVIGEEGYYPNIFMQNNRGNIWQIGLNDEINKELNF